MGNRCFLFVRGAGEEGEILSVAEGNNHVPSLWHVLLAEGVTGEPVTVQRIITADDDPAIETPVAGAMARWARAVAVLQQHPKADAVPALSRYLEAATAFLQRQVEAAGEGAVFTVDLSEIFMLDGTEPQDGIAEWQATFDAAWAAVRAVEQGQGQHRLDEWLDFGATRRRFEDWDAWRWSFGLGGLDHAYFQQADDDEPRTVGFADFVPEDRDDPWAWTGWWACPNEGGVVLQRNFSELSPDEAEPLRATAEAPGLWDEAVPARGWPAAWVRRGAHWGLMGLGETPALVLEPVLDEVGDIDADGTARVSQAGLWGVLNARGQWQLQPTHDGLGALEEGRRAFVQGERVGFLDAAGRVVVPAEYDEADDMQRGMARVARRAMPEGPLQWGLIDRDGHALQPCGWDTLESQPGHGWQAVKDGRMGWLAPRGALLLAPQWDEVQALDDDALLAVRRGEAWGLWVVAAPQDGEPARARELLPCLYAHLSLLATRPPDDARAAWHWALGMHAQRVPGWQRLARPDTPPDWAGALLLRVQMPDGLGATRLPAVYEALHQRDDINGPVRWLAGQLPGIHGQLLIDLYSGRVVLGGRGADGGQGYDKVWAVPISAPPDWWMSVRAQGPQGQLAQVWQLDGEPALAGHFEWLHQPLDLHNGWTASIAAQAMHRAWRAGRPVRAAPLPGPDGAVPRHQWVQPGQPPVDHEVHLAQAWAAGDAEAATQLAEDFQQGHGLPADADAARLWAARACGDDTASATEHPVPQPSALAMRLYASMLLDGEGGGADLKAARRWAERAAEAENLDRDRAGRSPALANLLGCILLRDADGPKDEKRAWRLFSKAADRGDATALFNQGVCLRDGRGVAKDLRKAITAFVAADEAGARNAAGEAAGLLRELLAAPGEVDDPDEAQRMARRTVYFCDKQLAALSDGSADQAPERERLQGLKDWALARLRGEVPADEAGDLPWWAKAILFPIVLPFIVVVALWRVWRGRSR